MKYYYVVYSTFFNGHELPEPKIVTTHPLLVSSRITDPVLFWSEISKDVANERKDLWLTDEA